MWKPHWGKNMYDEVFQIRCTGPVLRKLEREGKIGDVVMDIGSGNSPVAAWLRTDPKIITVDVGGKFKPIERVLHLEEDAEKASDESSFRLKSAIVKISEFLEVDLKVEMSKEKIDTMIFSQILNYVDFRRTLGAFSNYLKQGGRMIIINKPGRGEVEFPGYFSEKGVKNNTELFDFLKGKGFEIELNLTPWKEGEKEKDGEEMLVLVARKMSRDEQRDKDPQFLQR